MTVLIATLNITRYGVPESADELSRFRAELLSRGALYSCSFGSGQNARRVIPTGIFRTSDIEQMRMGVLEHLGIAQAPAWLLAAELREGTVIVF
jgi:LysR family transcriptional regulator for bpeEF and oprC